MPHGRNIYATEYDISMATICAYPPSQHALTHWKCVLHCCANFPYIDIPDQESDRHHSKTSTSIRFNIYPLIAHCTVHGRQPIDEKKICRLYFQDPATVTPEKLYTRKELAMM